MSGRDAMLFPRVLADEHGVLPAVDPDTKDIFLTCAPNAPAPWVSVADVTAACSALDQAVSRSPIATSTLLRLLRFGPSHRKEAALKAESLAFSTLLGLDEFGAWCGRRSFAPRLLQAAEPVRIGRDGASLTLTLHDPASGNAFGARMRDELAEALDSCLIDPTRPHVTIRGAGRTFCTGGALGEFGLATDHALAHQVRMEQSPVRRIWKLGHRVRVVMDGAAIGSGCEIGVAAHSVVISPRAWFQLPELAMGLIPGAGGTVTVPARIGYHRSVWMMLTGRRIPAATALRWGLADGIAG